MKHGGMLELPVLGLLKERDMHGYELRKQLGAMLGPLWQVSWGSLYPTLRRLARSGAVEQVPDGEVAGRGSKGTLGSGRRRTVYRVTATGDGVFKRLLEETAGSMDTEHFALKLAFFRYLRPETRLVLLERRRAYLQEKLASFRQDLRAYRERADSYALSLQDHEVQQAERDLAWIDELIVNERRPTGGHPKTTNA